MTGYRKTPRNRSAICDRKVAFWDAKMTKNRFWSLRNCDLHRFGYRLRKPLKWNPETETFADNEEANKLLSREPRAKWKI